LHPDCRSINKFRVRRKSLSSRLPHVRLFALAATLGTLAIRSAAAESAAAGGASRFLGATSCSSSACHGGGGQNQNQYLVWSLQDFHSQRPFATLTTARSKQIADALQIKDPTADERCTSCHAPLREVPESLRAEGFRVSEGVSCESCHGPAAAWLRPHTRSDWSHADRVFAGMRDLKNLYVRANTCVACHQTVAMPLLKACHPELIFELDGQSVSQPKHWRERANGSGAQAWLVGQAVALREMSWQLTREPAPDEKLAARWSALLWLLQRLDGLDPQFPKLGAVSTAPVAPNFSAALKAGDELGRRAAAARWTDEMSYHALKALASAGGDFQQPAATSQWQARRAERLVLALDRLLVAHKELRPGDAAEVTLNRLFKLVQSLPDFDAARFVEALDQFAHALDDRKKPE
jgi:hypothetical protein